jgi:hypothetical protein
VESRSEALDEAELIEAGQNSGHRASNKGVSPLDGDRCFLHRHRSDRS